MSNSAISLKGTVGQDALRNLINNAAFNEWNFGLQLISSSTQTPLSSKFLLMVGLTDICG